MGKRRILLLGATAYTGQRVPRQLLARGVDVTSTAVLARIFGPNDVVVSTVGPFMQLGTATLEAAVLADERDPEKVWGPWLRS